MVHLTSYDGLTVEVTEMAALKSKMVKLALEESSPEQCIPLVNISGEVLLKIVEYMTMQTEFASKKPQEIVEKSPELKAWKKDVETWEENYMDVSKDMLYDLYLGANYMDIGGLLSLCAEKIASLIRGKTTKEMRKIFNIENDFTPEEEEKYQANYKWAFID